MNTTTNNHIPLQQLLAMLVLVGGLVWIFWFKE